MEKIKCTHCEKECEKFEVFKLFGSTFCLHDQKLDDFKMLQGSPAKNDGISVSTTKGLTKREQDFKESEARKGYTVVKGSDGIVRSLSTN